MLEAHGNPKIGKKSGGARRSNDVDHIQSKPVARQNRLVSLTARLKLGFVIHDGVSSARVTSRLCQYFISAPFQLKCRSVEVSTLSLLLCSAGFEIESFDHLTRNISRGHFQHFPLDESNKSE
jgi:hypothetical protein